MTRRTENTARTATQTNGNLARLYVRDWRSEPVGRVKKALRQEILEWRAAHMEDGAKEDKQVETDVDAIRHVNQFGTPLVPVMEIACVPAKLGLVQKIFQANNIDIWDNINPFQEQSLDANDNSQDAKRFRKAHFTRLLLAWWKAANFVQSRDTALYYQRLINAAVRSPNELHKWQNFIIGVTIDAHGISDSKANPDIQFEYEQGFDPPPESNTRAATLQVRSLATGGTPAPCHAQKRQRQTQAASHVNPPTTNAGKPGPSTAPIPNASAPSTSTPGNLHPPTNTRNDISDTIPEDDGSHQAYHITPIAITQTPTRQLAEYFPSPTPARSNHQQARHCVIISEN